MVNLLGMPHGKRVRGFSNEFHFSIRFISACTARCMPILYTATRTLFLIRRVCVCLCVCVCACVCWHSAGENAEAILALQTMQTEADRVSAITALSSQSAGNFRTVLLFEQAIEQDKHDLVHTPQRTFLGIDQLVALMQHENSSECTLPQLPAPASNRNFRQKPVHIETATPTLVQAAAPKSTFALGSNSCIDTAHGSDSTISNGGIDTGSAARLREHRLLKLCLDFVPALLRL